MAPTSIDISFLGCSQRRLLIRIPDNSRLVMHDIKSRIETAYEATFGEVARVTLLLHPAFLPAAEVVLPLSEPICAALVDVRSIVVKLALPGVTDMLAVGRLPTKLAPRRRHVQGGLLDVRNCSEVLVRAVEIASGVVKEDVGIEVLPRALRDQATESCWGQPVRTAPSANANLSCNSLLDSPAQLSSVEDMAGQWEICYDNGFRTLLNVEGCYATREINGNKSALIGRLRPTTGLDQAAGWEYVLTGLYKHKNMFELLRFGDGDGVDDLRLILRYWSGFNWYNGSGTWVRDLPSTGLAMWASKQRPTTSATAWGGVARTGNYKSWVPNRVLEPVAGMCGISGIEREIMRELNALSAEHGSTGFGDCGKPNRRKLGRQVRFLRAAADRWPQFGTLLIREGQVAQECSFFLHGRAEYFRILAQYFLALNVTAESDEERIDLLQDLGFHLFEEFLTREEENDIVSYYGHNGDVYERGLCELVSKRRFFHYGPILSIEQEGTTKSTLGVIPARFGAFPELTTDSCQRFNFLLLDTLKTIQPPFDQMYVNFYTVATGAHIDFHHDHHLTMMGGIGGHSSGSACEFVFRPYECGLRDQTIRIELPRRSGYLMSGTSRYHLQHAIPKVRADRISITYRTVDKTCINRDEEILWQREWSELNQEEIDNAHWPLLPPLDNGSVEFDAGFDGVVPCVVGGSSPTDDAH